MPTGPWPNFCDVNWQQTVDAITQALGGGTNFDLLTTIGARNPDGTWNEQNWLYQTMNYVPRPIANAVAFAFDEFSKVITGEVSLGQAPVLSFLAPGLLRALAQLIHHITGIRVGGLEQKVDYWLNYLSPDLMPEVGHFNSMFLAKVISADQWRSGVRAHNYCDAWQELVLEVERERPGIIEMLKLDKLGLTAGPVDDNVFGTYGYLHPAEIDATKNLYRHYPGFEETLQWVTKGVLNDQYADQYGLDAGFAETWTEEAKRYADAGGSDGDLLLKRWRAHWDLPGVEFALDAFHRLRPGRVDADLVMSPDQVKQLLQANGIPPGWHDRYIELSRPKITRREMSVLYKMGAISKDEVVARLRDIGYVESFGKSIADSFQLQKVSQLSNMPESRAYVKGGIDSAKLTPVLHQYGASDDDAKLIYERLDREVDAASQEKIVEAFHKRFLAGDIPAGTLAGTLVQSGVDVITAQTWVGQWTAELASKEKHVEAGQLVSWYTQSLIPQVDLVNRLTRLGYQPDDVAGIVALADYRIQESTTKAIAAKKKADDKAKQQIAKQSTQAAKVAASAQRAAERLLQAINKVTVELGVHEKIPQDQAKQMVSDAMAKYRALPNSSDAGATQFIKDVWAIHSKKGGPTWPAVVDDYIGNLKAKQ